MYYYYRYVRLFLELFSIFSSQLVLYTDFVILCEITAAASIIKICINFRLLNDDEMGGGATRGHAIVVVLHLYKLLKSSRKFTELMARNFETTIKGVDCLVPFNDQLKVQYIYTTKRLILMIMMDNY